MRPLSEALADLIGFVEETVTRPARMPSVGRESRFSIIADEIRRADAQPSEGPRATRAGVVMVTVLEAFFAGDREPTSQMLSIAGATLPWLRGEAWTARKNEKEARGA